MKEVWMIAGYLAKGAEVSQDHAFAALSYPVFSFIEDSLKDRIS